MLRMRPGRHVLLGWVRCTFRAVGVLAGNLRHWSLLPIGQYEPSRRHIRAGRRFFCCRFPISWATQQVHWNSRIQTEFSALVGPGGSAAAQLLEHLDDVRLLTVGREQIVFLLV